MSEDSEAVRTIVNISVKYMLYLVDILCQHNLAELYVLQRGKAPE